ncbi:uncharacterized protein LOC113578081 isoform X2 [Electrophorus electricus]|uniref:uncharacterized protein LOC113578081 isoform X2 n=1 Tax=Electrophorus electricus TaxID=8005 RepID=UPI0015D00653|nr:uncharacterized protein LOC113578081 isoform X2 [Electrophorus electricus]
MKLRVFLHSSSSLRLSFTKPETANPLALWEHGYLVVPERSRILVILITMSQVCASRCPSGSPCSATDHCSHASRSCSTAEQCNPVCEPVVDSAATPLDLLLPTTLAAPPCNAADSRCRTFRTHCSHAFMHAAAECRITGPGCS